MRNESSPRSRLVDLEAIESLIAKRSAQPIRRSLGIGVLVLAITLGPTVVLPLAFGEGWHGIVEYVRAEPWGSVWLPLGLAAVLCLVSAVIQSRRAARDPFRVAQRIERDWRLLTDDSWVRRTVLVGVVMGGLVGFPIGTLLALDARPSELPELGGRVGIVLSFVAMTLLWTLPGAFWIRYHAVREYRPLLHDPHSVARSGPDR